MYRRPALVALLVAALAVAIPGGIAATAGTMDAPAAKKKPKPKLIAGEYFAEMIGPSLEGNRTISEKAASIRAV